MTTSTVSFPGPKTGILLSYEGTDLRCDYFPRHLCRDGEEPEFIYYLCRRQENAVPDLTPLAIDQALEWFNAHSGKSGTKCSKLKKIAVPPSTPMGASRPPLDRMTRVHAELKANRFPNCKKLAALLETSPKTIQRDIDFMRDRLGLPIDYDQKRWGYFYFAEPATGLVFPLDCLTAIARA